MYDLFLVTLMFTGTSKGLSPYHLQNECDEFMANAQKHNSDKNDCMLVLATEYYQFVCQHYY